MELSLAKPALIRKPLLLKDYLLDDLSSCSSSGFRSYPRKQCCTTVRFLLEMDLKNKPPKYIKKPPHKSPSKLSSSSSSSSAFQRASTAVINAVKSPSSLSNRLKLTLLPRTLSRKLLKRSFWKRTDRKEIQRKEPINQIVVKNSPPPPPPSDFTCSPTSGNSRNSTSDSNCKSNSWSDSDFTVSDISSCGNSAVKILNKDLHDVVSMENTNNNLPKDKTMMSSKRVGVIVGGYDSMEPTTSSNSNSATNSNNLKKQWPNHEEDKEQFSPVSVFDCPFDDDDEVSSPFQHRLARMEGTKKRLMKNIKKFERLTQLEPVNLEKRIVLSDSDQDSNGSPHQLHSSESTGSRGEDFIVDSEEEENNIEAADHKSFKLLQLVKATTTPGISMMKLKADYDKLLLDFFKEGIEMGNNSSLIGHAVCRLRTIISVSLDDHELLNVAKDWIAGQYHELFLGWEVQKNREAYIRGMERMGKWRKSNEEEKQELALELEVEVFASLMDELFTDLVSS